MGTKDFIDLFKLNILKNWRFYILFICWFVLFAYIQSFLTSFPFILKPLISLRQNIFKDEYWPIPVAFFRSIIWVLSFVFFKEVYELFIWFKKRGSKTYQLTKESWYRDWKFNGKPKLLLDPLRLRINSSRAGCLYEKQVWKDFEMKFKVNFLSNNEILSATGVFGIIFRAQDLNNYFMIELEKGGSGELSAKPHIRYQGMWEVMKEERVLTGTDAVSFDVKLIVKDAKVELKINNTATYEWHLPLYVDINLIEIGTKSDSDGDKNKFPIRPKSSLPKIEFRNSYGMIGFRAHTNQGADIIDLSINKKIAKGKVEI